LRSNIIGVSLKRQFFDLCGFDYNQEWNHIYRASVDGFRANDFHSRCDNKQGTLIIIKTNEGYIFGGYTEALWNQLNNQGEYKSDPNTFIFSLINKDSKPIKINLNMKREKHAIMATKKCGPVFGKRDFHVCDNSNVSKQSGSNLGISFVHPEYPYKSEEAETFLAGSSNFLVEEIEVFHKIK